MSAAVRGRSRKGAGRSKKRSDRTGRFSLLLALLALALAVVAGRLVYIQMIVGPAYASEAAEQRTSDIVLSPERGFILDREGEVLAESMEARTVYAVPSAVKDKQATATAVARVLGGEESGYLEKLNKGATFVYLARRVEVERAESLEELGLQGIGFLEDSRRVYPNNELACQVLGFVGVDNDGLAGIEKFYDELLAGETGRLICERDPDGRPIPGGVSQEVEPVNGQDIVLTIDADIQYQAQVMLAETVKEWGAKSGSVLVMDPETGELYAMASLPTFDPNTHTAASEAAYRNRPLLDTYEPGSTIKAMTASAVIDAGLFKPESMIELPPTLKVGGRTIHDAHTRPKTVTWSLTDIVTHSSNIGAAKVAMELGGDSLYDYFARFGLTRRTGVDFPGEAIGWLPPTDQWSSSSIGTIPFGQGISVTPIQLARAFSVIANGGTLVTPHFLKSVPDSPAMDISWPTEQVDIKPETCETMRSVLVNVVEEGTATRGTVKGYQVCGKTGTAQKARTDGKAGYAPGRYVSSFTGFLPADDPQVLILITLDEPSKAIYGGTVAGPMFGQLAAYCVEHLKIPPGDPVTPVPQSDGG